MPLTRCTLTGQDPCQGVISQLVGPVVPVTIPRTETATRVAGTDDHLTRPDSEDNSESP